MTTTQKISDRNKERLIAFLKSKNATLYGRQDKPDLYTFDEAMDLILTELGF
jgi:hypothetical protein